MAYGLSKTRIRNQLYIKRTDYAHYQRLAYRHYVHRDIHPFTSIWGVFPRLPWLNRYPHPVAITVYAPALPNLRARARAFADKLNFPADLAERLRFVNEHFLYASRLIVDPRYEKLGIGVWLAQETLRRQPVPYIETLTPCDDLAGLMSKIGFRSYAQPAPDYYARVKRALLRIGVAPELHKHPDLVHRRIERLPAKDRDMILYELQRFVNHFKSHMLAVHTVSRTSYIIDKLYYPEVYHVWTNDNPENSTRKTR